MNRFLAFTLLTLLSTTVAAQEELWMYRDSLNAAYSMGGPADRLAAVKSVGSFQTAKSTQLLIQTVPRQFELIDAIVSRRDLVRNGRDSEVNGRNPGPTLTLLKDQLDAEYRVIEAIETCLSRLTDQSAILYLAKTVLLRDRHWKPREVSGRILSRIGDRSVIPFLAKALKDKDARVKTAALLSLGAMRAEEVNAEILKVIGDKDWMVRSAAIEALGKIRDPRSFLPLLKQMQIEEGLLADECIEALERITGQDLGDAVGAWKQWWAENGERAMRGERLEPRPPPPEPDSSEAGKYYHEIKVVSKRTLFILDISESMSYSNEHYQKKPGDGETSRLDLAKRELTKTLNHYGKKGTFGLIAFHTVVKSWRPRIVPATKIMRQDAIEWVEDLDPTGTTNIYGALETAFRLAGMGVVDKYYPPAADTIYLLSDGAPTNQDLSKDDSGRILRAVRQWNKLGRMKIHTIGLKGHDVEFMRRLAEANGGQYVSRGR